MTTTVPVGDNGTSPAAKTQVPSWTRWAALAIVAALVAVVAVFAERWRTGLDEFRPAGNVQLGPIPVGTTGYIGEEAWRERGSSLRVDLKSVAAVVTRNTADATISVLLCRGGSDHDDAAIGFVYNPRPYCSRLTKFRPGNVDLGPHRADLLVAVSPRRTGTVRITGIQVSYADGLRRGNQLTGFGIRTHTP